jgi:hypothetical protein
MFRQENIWRNRASVLTPQGSGQFLQRLALYLRVSLGDLFRLGLRFCSEISVSIIITTTNPDQPSNGTMTLTAMKYLREKTYCQAF